jgi:hypothetical protein
MMPTTPKRGDAGGHPGHPALPPLPFPSPTTALGQPGHPDFSPRPPTAVPVPSVAACWPSTSAPSQHYHTFGQHAAPAAATANHFGPPQPTPLRLGELTPEPYSMAAAVAAAVASTPPPSERLRHSSGSSRPDSGKRGRPRADAINHLIIEGSSSPSEIKCGVCQRVFPREKSLQVRFTSINSYAAV